MTDVNRTDATATADGGGVMRTAGQQAFETELRRLRAIYEQRDLRAPAAPAPSSNGAAPAADAAPATDAVVEPVVR
jgi:hypothetical protein